MKSTNHFLINKSKHVLKIYELFTTLSRYIGAIFYFNFCFERGEHRSSNYTIKRKGKSKHLAADLHWLDSSSHAIVDKLYNREYAYQKLTQQKTQPELTPNNGF